MLSLSVTELSLSSSTYEAAVGSLEGGTLVYVKGIGFSTNINGNSVSLGTYPCIVELNGLSANLIACRTTKATNINFITNLSVKVTVLSSTMTCSSTTCLYNYQ